MMNVDTANMCSHLQKKLFEEDGVYHHLWTAMQDDAELTAVVRSRQLHIYRNGKKVLVLAGKSAQKSSKAIESARCYPKSQHSTFGNLFLYLYFDLCERNGSVIVIVHPNIVLSGKEHLQSWTI